MIPITSEMKGIVQQKAKVNSGHGQEVLRRDASTGKYVQVRGMDLNRHMQHAPVRGVYTRESPVNRPSQSPGPRIVTHNESQRCKLQVQCYISFFYCHISFFYYHGVSSIITECKRKLTTGFLGDFKMN